jgi:hypothetical protein
MTSGTERLNSAAAHAKQHDRQDSKKYEKQPLFSR